MFGAVRKEFLESAEETYREFNRSLVPGESNVPMLGVRMPKIREIAKKLAKNGGRDYLEAVCRAEDAGAAYHEEYLLHGILTAYLKCSVEERKQLLDVFIPRIQNWAVCDSTCLSCKFIKKDMELWYEYLETYLESSEEYEIRFGCVCLLNYHITEEYIGRVLQWMDRLRHEGYYVKMAVAWVVSVCFVKFPEETKEFLLYNHMDDFTHNKSIQKICESYRVSREDKEWVKTLKRVETREKK